MRQRDWMFSSVVSGLQARRTSSRSAASVASNMPSIENVAVMPRRACCACSAASFTAHVRRCSATASSLHLYPIRTESIDGDRERQRGIDAAGQPHHHARKAVLGRRSRARRAPARGRRFRRRRSPAHVLRERASKRRLWPHGARRRATNATCASSPSNTRGARSTTVPSASITKDWPSNTSSSWPPSRLQYTTGRPTSRTRSRTTASRACCLRCSNGEALMTISSSAPCERASCAGSGSQMSSQISRPTCECHGSSRRSRLRAGFEIALLVEHAVVRQAGLAMIGEDRFRPRATLRS